MSVDGPGFHVEVDSLETAAQGIARSAAEQDQAKLSGLSGGAELYGHGGVQAALEEFCQRWSAGLDTLTGDADTIGDSLRRTAAVYRDIDEHVARTMTDPAVDAVDE